MHFKDTFISWSVGSYRTLKFYSETINQNDLIFNAVLKNIKNLIKLKNHEKMLKFYRVMAKNGSKNAFQ